MIGLEEGAALSLAVWAAGGTGRSFIVPGQGKPGGKVPDAGAGGIPLCGTKGAGFNFGAF